MAVTLSKVEKWARKKNIKKLLKALSSGNTDIRTAIIKELGLTKDESAMNTLISLLKDPDAVIRANAAEALGSMGIGRSLEFVRQLWNIETNELVREKAIQAIAAIKQSAAKQEKL